MLSGDLQRESIYYLTGLTYEPLERPFFILVSQEGNSTALTPAPERNHFRNAPNVSSLRTYWDYPSPAGDEWQERVAELLTHVECFGVEPSLSQEIAVHLSPHNPRVSPLIEGLRLVKSENEIAMMRHAARFVTEGVEAIIGAPYYGISEIEIFSLGRSILTEIIKTTDFDPLNTSVTTAAWPARLALQPHGIPFVDDRLERGPISP